MSSGRTTDRASEDFYGILGVPRDADADAIQRAYRKLARQYHPDINSDPGAEERFKDLSEAYDVLSDPDTRARYDRFGGDFRRMAEGAERWAGAGAGAGAGVRAGAGNGPGFRFEGFDFEDLFGGTGGGFFHGRGRAGPVSGADQEAEVQVTIPPGVTHGQRLRLAGQGGRGRDGGDPGDLYLVVRLGPDPRFRVEGRDVHTDLPLAPWEGVLGTKVAITTPDGEQVTVTVPPGTSTGRKLRLRGKGLPRPARDSRRGDSASDLYAHARIMVPTNPTPRETELFRELAEVSSFNPRERP
ncbi:DnaJ C-terminal domain-containing protein [Parafrankia sp. EUN1f]|uniref:DnaJ C-terminal domain-containing protein n=1 Tax=Parafrankia sp. EUN1f TaxID=102897 RepID=UPI0001C468F0|nr:DnaJ C-terminal domain-containing protein [Parafrankia sp. EUN1f]EFC80372.1 chaperone DnaJ domain protein [Parafrankia sp. EUN1f]